MLTGDERRQLEAIAASRSLPQGVVRRANMILLTESGVRFARRRGAEEDIAVPRGKEIHVIAGNLSAHKSGP